jgi:hypothetical protein
MRRYRSTKTALYKSQFHARLWVAVLFLSSAVFVQASPPLMPDILPPPEPITIEQPATNIAIPVISLPGQQIEQPVDQQVTPPVDQPSGQQLGQPEIIGPVVSPETNPASESSIGNDPEWHAFLITNRMEQAQLALENERARVDYAKKYYQYQTDNLTFVHDVFVWNDRQSVFISIIAHLLLLLGVGAAYYEFRHAMKLREKAHKQDEINVGLEGVALKTSLRAIWLLVSAFVFYFLYIKFVYTITVL